MKEHFRTLDLYLRKNNLFNGNLLSANKKEVLYQSSFGLTFSHKQHEFMNADTVFELAFVSKQFTAYLISFAFTAHEGIGSGIRKFKPDLAYQNISTRHLLYHNSRLPDDFSLFEAYWDKNKITLHKDVFNLIIKS